jgi:cytoskeletal protein CcmA (bactofilin family)
VNEVQVVMYCLIALFLVLLLFPIVNAVFYFKKYKSGILYINQERVRDARYFGKAFASLIESQLSDGNDNQIKLSQLETFINGDVQTKYPSVVPELVICRINEFYTPIGVQEFQKEIYSANNIVLNQGRLIARALYSRKNIILGSETHIERWVDANGTLAIYNNCNLGISASSKERMSIGEGCSFRRLFAPEIRIGQYPGSNLDSTHGKNPKIYRMPIQNNKERNIKYIRKEMINDDGVVDFSLVSSRNVIINEKIIVQGDVRSHKGVKLWDDAVVCGNVFAEGDVILGRNAVILGNVFSQGNIVLEEGAVLGQQGRICSAIARGSITFSKNTFVFGYVSCEREGKIVENHEYQPDVKPYEEVEFLELNKPISKITFNDLYDYEHVDQQGFRFREELEEVEIPIGAVKVPKSMFFRCSALAKVVLPHTIQTLEDHAFADCHSLHSIPNFNHLELRTIGVSVFENCQNMKDITIPATVEQINAAAFARCQSLTNIEFEMNSKLRWIGDHCFRGCKSLKVLRLPEQTEYVGVSAFLECSSLESLQIPVSCKDSPGILECPPEIIEIYDFPPVTPIEEAEVKGALT